MEVWLPCLFQKEGSFRLACAKGKKDMLEKFYVLKEEAK